MPASAYARRSTSTCASGFGAVRPLEWPSELVAEPLITASTSSPSAMASSTRLSTMKPAASARTKPSASSENALILPVGLITPSSANAVEMNGEARIFTPPASATSASPPRSARTAWCTDTSEDEHAVSTFIDGPRKSKAYEIRFGITALDVPVSAYGCADAGSEVMSMP